MNGEIDKVGAHRKKKIDKVGIGWALMGGHRLDAYRGALDKFEVKI